jgi:ribosomal protein S18 acetylase RimI-like enzyme
MEEVTIEPAGTDDVTEVTGMWVELATGQREHGSHVLPEANRTAIREAVARHAVGDTLLVARSDGPAGFVMFTVETGSFEQDRTRGVVENLYVVPERRSEGIGTALLEAAEATLRDRGVDGVTLDVMAANQQAREFYRRRGYHPHRVELEKPAESDTHTKDGR